MMTEGRWAGGFAGKARTIVLDEAGQVLPPVSGELVEAFCTVLHFLDQHPGAASPLRGSRSPVVGSEDYIRRQFRSFISARQIKPPRLPETIPDEMVSVILVTCFGIAPGETDRIKQEHLKSMAAENVVGGLLEHYLASELEPRGWVWCSGSLVRAVDFIRPPLPGKTEWSLLQVKNRDNSENSSSSAIRAGTEILKWHRTFSRRVETNWPAFPDEALRSVLSEEGFKAFVRDRLARLST